MISRLLPTLVLFAMTLGGLAAAPVDFNDGESFRFRIGWGIFGNAGELTVNAEHEDYQGEPAIRVTSHTRTAGLIRGFYPFDGMSQFYFDSDDGRILWASAKTVAKKRRVDAVANFDHKARLVHYEDRSNPSRNVNLRLPAGQPMDMITMMLNARNWDLEVGETKDVVVMFDREFYDLKVVAEKVERVRVADGWVDALVVVPRMEKNPRGIFRKGGQIRIWISQDSRRLPLKFDLKMNVGTGTAYLTEHNPGVMASVANADSGL